MWLRLFIVLSTSFFIIGSLHGQVYLADIQFDKVNQKKVEEYIYRQLDEEIETFTELKPSLTPESSTEGYRYHEREYVLKDSFQNIWWHYVHTNPADAWNAGKMKFGMMFSKQQNELFYFDERVEKIDTGQVVYLNLNIMKGIKNIATAFEIITVDREKGMIEFSYIEDNLTKGKQQLLFFETPKGHTKIVHNSYFKSHSALRDYLLYPYFHTRMTNTFHRNMKKMYKAKRANTGLKVN